MPLKIITAFIFLGLLWTYSAQSQNFGCYSTEALNPRSYLLLPANRNYGENNAKKWSAWKTYKTKNVPDGYYAEYYSTYPDYPKQIKMEGMIKDGKRQGKWRLYDWILWRSTQNSHYNYLFYTGNYIDGLKEGKWMGFEGGSQKDTILTWQATFVHDKLTGTQQDQSDSSVWRKAQYTDDSLNGLAKIYFRDGQKEWETNYKNGRKEGEEVEYKESREDEDNKRVLSTASIKYYVNDSLSGLCINFDGWGQKEIEMENFAHGKKQGRCIYFHNGFITQMGDYENDLLNGEMIDYYDSGEIATKMIYKNGLPYTIVCQFAENGTELYGSDLKNGNGILKTYYSTGQLNTEYTYQDQALNGPFREYDDSGRLTCDGIMKWDSGSRYLFGNNGPLYWYDYPRESCKGTTIKEYYLSGKLKHIELYPENDTTFYNHDISYFENEKPSSEYFLNPNKTSVHILTFYKNGNMESEIHSKRDSSTNRGRFFLDGVQKYYFENGKPKAIVYYSMGAETGYSVFYDEDGILMREHFIFSDSSEYNVFNRDTVNRLDKYKRKQGKWISLPDKYNEEEKNNPCDIEPASIEYYKDGKPIGTWFRNPNSERFYSDSVKITWVDSVKAYYINYRAYNDKGERVQEEGYILDQCFKIGTWKELAVNKKGATYLEWEGEYINGLKEGMWKQFKKNGKLKTQVLYHKDYSVKGNQRIHL